MLVRLYALLCLLPLLAGITALAFVGLALNDRVYPNVAVGGVDVGGLTSAEATARIRDHATRALRRPLLLSVQQDTVATTLADVGVSLRDDRLRRAVTDALAVGRPRPGVLAFDADSVRHLMWLSQYGEHVALPLTFQRADARDVLTHAAYRLNQPAADAYVELIPTEGGYELHTLPAVTGRRIDVEAALEQIGAFVAQGVFDGGTAPLLLDVPVVLIPPAIDDDAVSALSARIGSIVGAPIAFDTGRVAAGGTSADDAGLRLETAALAKAIRVVGMTPVAYFGADQALAARRAGVELDEPAIARMVIEVAAQADVPAQEPRLELQGGRVGVRPGRPGRIVDREAAVKRTLDILRAALDPALAAPESAASRVVPLAYRAQAPTLDPAALGPAAEVANARLALPLTFTYQVPFDGPTAGGQPAPSGTSQQRALGPAELSRLLSFTGGDGTLDRDLVRARLAEWLPAWVRLDPELAAQEPSLEIRGGRLVLRPGRPGLTLDFDALAADTVGRFESLDPQARIVAVRPQTMAPRRTEAELLASSPAATLVAQPVSLYSFAGEWTLSTEDLVAAVRFTTRAGQSVPVLDAEALATRVAVLARDVQEQAQRLGLRDTAGRPVTVDLRRTADGVLAALASGTRSAPIEWAGSTTS